MKSIRKLIVLLLVAAMSLSCFPMAALATDIEEIPQVETMPVDEVFTSPEEEETSAPEETEQVAEETDPIIEEAAPVIEETEPVTEETEPVIEETEPAVPEEVTTKEEAVNTAEEIATPTIEDSGTCGENLTWTRDSDGVLTISGTGRMKDYQLGSRNPPWCQNIHVKKIVVEEGVTYIGREAFIHMNNAVSVELPETLTSIGDYAFKRCVALEEITLPSGLKEIGTHAFDSCLVLKRIEIPAGVEELDSYTFENCLRLSEVILHEGLLDIDSYAFSGTNLTIITIPSTVTAIHSHAFNSCPVKEITFLGNLPEFQEDSLSGIVSFARYPEDNATWTDDVRKDYGGKITWVDHKHVHNFEEVTVDPTCEEWGYTGTQCTLCGGILNAVKSSPLGHDLAKATCTDSRRCQREGCTYTEGESLGHAWQNPNASPLVCRTCGITDYHQHEYNETIVKPNCTENGYTTFVCKVCKYSYVGDNVDALGHSPGAPNCTTGAICGACGEVCETPIPHEYKTEWNQGNIYGHWHDCKNCSTHTKPEMHIPNVEFSTTKTAKICTECGFLIEEKLDSDNVTVVAEGLWDFGPVKWKITSDGVLTISGNTHIQGKTEYIWKDYSDIITRIVIADGITRIPEDCFSNMQNVTSVYLGNKIEVIDARAFENCDKLYEVSIPKSVKEIGIFAFQGCDNLVSLQFEDGSKLKSINDYVFRNCTALQNIYFAEGLQTISSWAFTGSQQVKHIRFPESLVSLDTRMVDTFQELETLENYSAVQLRSFSGHKALKTVIWSGKNTTVNAEFFKDCTALSTVVLGNNVTSIGDDVFNGCSSLSKVVIGDNITSISHGAFSGCTSLSNVVMGANITSLSNAAFSNCTSLTALVLPEKLETISMFAFSNTGLKRIRIPAAVKLVSLDAFADSKVEHIIFDGNAPTFGVTAFRNVTAMVTYHGNNSTWTENKRQNYYGNITWVDMDQHDHVYSTVTVKPTCLQSGYTTYDCFCGYSSTDNFVDALGHNYTRKVVSPSYTQKGYRENTCTACGDTYKDNYTNPKGLPKPVVTVSNNSKGKPVLKWTDRDEAKSFYIYRASSKSGTYKKIGSTETGTYTDTSASLGKTYYYKVKAIASNSKYNSAYSTYDKAVCKCAAPVITVAASTGSGKPVIKWKKITGAAKYTVYRATSEDGKYTALKTTTSTSYTDTSAKLGTTYYYKVKAIHKTSTYNSAYSTIKSCLTVCAKPVVRVTISSTTGKPTLTWKEIAGAVSYEIYRAGADGQYAMLANQSSVKYADKDVQPDTDYQYKVKAIGSKEELNSAYSAVKKVHTTLAKPKVTFSNNSKGKPKLTWNEVDGAVSYRIYRSSYATKSYKLLKTVKSTEYTDTSVSTGKGYYYKVIAIGANCKSAYSSYKKLYGKCAAPVITVAANSTSGKPVIKWKKITGAAKYTVYRATSEDGKYTALKTTTSTSYTDTSAKLGTTYYYKVKAIHKTSTYSSSNSSYALFECVYVVNTNTGKFHYSHCKNADDIYEENRLDYRGAREDLVNQGYVPCKNCNP